MYLGATVPGKVGRGCEKAPLLVAVEAAGPGGPGRCSIRVASDVTAASYREFLRRHVGVLARVRFDGFLPIACAAAGWPHAEPGGTPSGGAPGTGLRMAHKVISNLRAYAQGTFHGLSRTRMQGAVDEFCWRYSHRAPSGPGIASELLGEAVRGHVPRAELLSAVFAPQGPGGRLRNRGRGKRENERWPAIEVEGGRVAGRAVRAVPRLGCDRGMRFEHAHNLAGCRRAVLEDEVCTALYGYGAGIPVVDETGAFTGGYRRKLTFGEVNGGVNWVGDEAARMEWGLPDADGTGRAHRFGEVTFPDVEDAQTLKERTLAALPEACAPKVRYEVDAALVEGSDRAGLGDDVAVVDASRDPEWRFKSRVVGRARTFGDGWTDVQLTIGQPKSTAYAAASEATARATAAEDAAGAAGDVALAARSRVDALNEAAGAAEDGTVPALATKAYVDAAIAALDDLSEVEF